MATKSTKIKKTPKNTYNKVNHAHEPRAKFIKRVLIYSLFTVITIVLSVLVFYRAKGYTFTKSGQVEKRGIVLIDSAPLSAKIYIDDKDIGKNTDYKLEVNEGNHNMRLEAEGYRTWQTSFSIKSEQVEWFYYPYLIPNVLSPQVIQDNLALKTYSSLSPESKVMAASKTGTGLNQSFSLELLNLKESDPAKITSPVIVPSQLFSKQSDGSLGEIKFEDWSADGSSIYLTHTLPQKKEFINLRLNSPLESTNLTNAIGSGITEFSYDDKSRLYILNSGEYAIYNPVDLAKESVIDSGVLTARNFRDDKYVYAKNPVNPGEAGMDIYVKESQNQSKKVLNTLVGGPGNLDFQYTTNRRVDYLSISNSANKELMIFSDPLKAEKAPEPLFLSTFESMKSNQIKQSLPAPKWPGSYIAMQLTENSIFVYSFDDETSITYNLKDLNINDISWIDSERLQAKTADGGIYYFDYDNNYLNEIAKTNQPFSYFIAGEDKTVIINSSTTAGKEVISQIKFKI